jgi:hypothetical protein
MKCDLHVHSYASYDSISSPKSIIKEAVKKGINCLAITDHGEVKAYNELKRIADRENILIVKGIEVKSKKGDIIGLNIKERIPEGLSVQETIKRIKKQEGFIVIPHPFFKYYKFQENLKNILDKIDAIEILNSAISEKANKEAFKFVRDNNFPFTAGSDAHSSFFVGRTYLEVPGDNLSIKEIFNLIKTRNVKAKGRELGFFEVIQDRLTRNSIKFLNLWT